MTDQAFDTNLYSRQIGTFGMETMGKLIKMKVLLLGLRGLGVEIAKNIILAGPKEVAIYDPEKTTINDLGSNFFLTESDVGTKRRDEACLAKLAELNPYVQTRLMEGDDIFTAVKAYNIVVISELMNRSDLIKLNLICRENNIGLIYSATLGITGYCFVDFGEKHIIRDKNGEECKTFLARIITKDEVGAVTIDDSIGSGKLTLVNGDYVTFKEVKGMTELNDGVPRKVKCISPISFSIGDTSKYGEYTGGGIIEQVKMPIEVSYAGLDKRFDTPYDDKKGIDPIDFSKFGRNELLHCGFLAVHEFYMAHNNTLPELNNETHAQEVLAKAKEIYNKGKESKSVWMMNAQEFDDKIILALARWARSEISPICAFLGGIVAQEIVKLTGKYTPINQWLWFDFYETVANLPDNTDRTVNGTRYDDQIAIYGNEIQKKLNASNIFMIGAGALGCEFLKNFALMGIAVNTDKKVTVTDNDSIETSNLNRQFLFRKDNVGNSKSKCACIAVKQMNPQFNCTDLQSRVGPENEHIFNEAFWDSQTFIINAVDNINARKYIDNQCTKFCRPLIDSGTLGTKAHVQMIIPHVTSCYNDTQDPVEESVPMCTMHNFPAMIEHCIEWGRDHFNEYFTDVINDAKKLIESPDEFYNDLKKEGNVTLQLTKLSFVKDIVVLAAENNFDKVIEFAVKQYTENFDYRISQLLHNFPPDYKNKDGSMFWSGSKRVPHPIRYDANDSLCLSFVKNYAVILARALSISANESDEYIKTVSAKVNIPAFTPKNVFIKVNDNDEGNANDNANASANTEEDKQLTALIELLKPYDKTKIEPTKLKPEEFEKDDDTNGHIAWVHACSNIRARNYKIKESELQKTKMIAGKIIPAIATTTAAITGIVSLQLYTLFQTQKIDYMRNCFLNLAVCLFVMTEPAEKVETQDKEYDELLLGPVKAIPPKWTVWDKINIDGSKTVQEFIDYMKNTYNVDISVIAAEGVTIVSTFLPSNKDRFPKKIEDIYNEHSKVKLSDTKEYLFLEISGDVDDATALMPLIKYNFKK